MRRDRQGPLHPAAQEPQDGQVRGEALQGRPGHAARPAHAPLPPDHQSGQLLRDTDRRRAEGLGEPPELDGAAGEPAQGDRRPGGLQAGRLGGRGQDGRPGGLEAGGLGRGRAGADPGPQGVHALGLEGGRARADRRPRGHAPAGLGRGGGRGVGGAPRREPGVQGRLREVGGAEDRQPGLQGQVARPEDRQPRVQGRLEATADRKPGLLCR
mmetsp:Transcript_91042/g.266576  ORF Transcript_91042/g.266576 Transcript_91042/m.266576 type:complete len:212 (-) Transcript_91042:728-1363(-)